MRYYLQGTRKLLSYYCIISRSLSRISRRVLWESRGLNRFYMILYNSKPKSGTKTGSNGASAWNWFGVYDSCIIQTRKPCLILTCRSLSRNFTKYLFFKSQNEPVPFKIQILDILTDLLRVLKRPEQRETLLLQLLGAFQCWFRFQGWAELSSAHVILGYMHINTDEILTPFFPRPFLPLFHPVQSRSSCEQPSQICIYASICAAHPQSYTWFTAD